MTSSRMGPQRVPATFALMALVGAVLAACGGSSGGSSAESAAPVRSYCQVRLHGKGGSGQAPEVRSNDLVLVPEGNASGWGGRQWLYFPADRYAQARDVVAAAVDAAGCAAVVVDGFSNGAAFAASLYCHGETFDGRLRGVVVDDPVPDAGTVNCTPGAGVRVALYWTGALKEAEPGASCEPIDWTCEGGSMVGIKAYAAAMGAQVQQSPNTSHESYQDPPEIAAWFASPA